MRRISALISILAMSSATLPAAFAQGWDDATPITRPPEPTEQGQQISPQSAYEQALQRLDARNEARIQAIRQRTGQENSPAEQQLRMQMNNPLLGEGYVEDGSVKYRMEQGPDGNMHVVEDKRGDMPDFANGFGGFNPNQKQEQDPRQMTTLTPEMVRALQERSAQMAPPKNPMFEKADGSGFFGGMKAPTKAESMDASEFKTRHDDGQPAWAKDKMKNVHHYVDGQEHHGAEDPHGFF